MTAHPLELAFNHTLIITIIGYCYHEQINFNLINKIYAQFSGELRLKCQIMNGEWA